MLKDILFGLISGIISGVPAIFTLNCFSAANISFPSYCSNPHFQIAMYLLSFLLFASFAVFYRYTLRNLAHGKKHNYRIYIALSAVFFVIMLLISTIRLV